MNPRGAAGGPARRSSTGASHDGSAQFLPNPFAPEDETAGYRYELSVLAGEFSLIPMLDRPASGVVVAASAVGPARRRAPPRLRRSGRLLAVTCFKSAVMELMRVAWRTVRGDPHLGRRGRMAGVDRFGQLRRIGIEEISYKEGHRYLSA